MNAYSIQGLRFLGVSVSWNLPICSSSTLMGRLMEMRGPVTRLSRKLKERARSVQVCAGPGLALLNGLVASALIVCQMPKAPASVSSLQHSKEFLYIQDAEELI